MNIWKDLVKTAVVGTQRRDLKILEQDNQLNDALSCLDINDKEGSLLSAAVVISLYKKAGKLAVIDNKTNLETCELDDFPCCNQLSEEHLRMILNGEYRETLLEFLKVTAEVGKVVSPRYLPDLLALGKRQHHLRKDILPVLGKRGIWLAAQNPEWNYIIAKDTDKIWKNSSLEARKDLLKELRQSEPEKGRRQLQNIWSKERAQERATLLSMLEFGLSIDDEPFLEDTLEDRSKQVRDVAARLLAQIPESRLVQRMIERVLPLLNLDKNGIEVLLPKKCTLSMTQDGIDESKYIPSLGEKASLLLQMLASVPPSLWSDRWQKTPVELIKIIENSKWERLFLEAWVTATIRSQDAPWAEALLKVSAKLYQKLSNVDELIKKLLKVLPYSQVQDSILDVLQQYPDAPFNSANPAFPLLIHTPYIWNEEISQVVILSIKSCIESNRQGFPSNFFPPEKSLKGARQVNKWQFTSALAKFSLQIAPSIYSKAADTLTLEMSENISQSLIEAIDRFLAKLQFRFEMREALNS